MTKRLRTMLRHTAQALVKKCVWAQALCNDDGGKVRLVWPGVFKLEAQQMVVKRKFDA